MLLDENILRNNVALSPPTMGAYILISLARATGGSETDHSCPARAYSNIRIDVHRPEVRL